MHTYLHIYMNAFSLIIKINEFIIQADIMFTQNDFVCRRLPAAENKAWHQCECTKLLRPKATLGLCQQHFCGLNTFIGDVNGLNIKNRNSQCYFYEYFYVNCHEYPKHVMFMLAVNYLESRLLFRFQLPTLISNISQCQLLTGTIANVNK